MEPQQPFHLLPTAYQEVINQSHQNRLSGDALALDPAVKKEKEPKEEPPPEPSEVQQEALAALAASRGLGYRRGLVVMATGWRHSASTARTRRVRPRRRSTGW